MTWWPGWDSIESAAFWSHFWFWFGIACLFALGASEIVSHVYGLRKDGLVAAAETAASAQRKSDANAAEDRRKAETKALQQRLNEADKRVADAQQAAVQAAKKAGEVERKAAARHLTEDQRKAILDAITPFPNVSLKVAVTMGDGEGMDFANEFISLFRKASWNVDGPGQAIYTGPPTYGVQVTLNESDAASNRLPYGAEPLIHILIAVGLTKGGFVNPQTPSGQMEFRVGPKPPS